MVQTQVQLTDKQMASLKRLAKKRHVSPSDLIREGINNVLQSSTVSSSSERKKRALAVAGRFRSGLKDLAEHHDNYLEEAFEA